MTEPAFLPSKHCTFPGCKRTDTETADGVKGRRCPDHPATFERAYLIHLLEHAWFDVALAYARWVA